MIDDDDERAWERLRELGLLHLADQPDALRSEIDKRIADRDEKVATYEARRRSPTPSEAERPTPETERPARKPSLLLLVSATAGPCGKCRHANQRSADLAERRLYCSRHPAPRTIEQHCDVTVSLPTTIPTGAEETWGRYFYFERHDGTNGTWGINADYRLLAEDADGKLQEFQQAHLKSI